MGWRYRYAFAVGALCAAYGLLLLGILSALGRMDLLADENGLFLGALVVLFLSTATLAGLGELLAGTRVGEWIRDMTVERVLESNVSSPPARRAPTVRNQPPRRSSVPDPLQNAKNIRATGKWLVIVSLAIKVLDYATLDALGGLWVLVLLAGIVIYFAGKFAAWGARRHQT